MTGSTGSCVLSRQLQQPPARECDVQNIQHSKASIEHLYSNSAVQKCFVFGTTIKDHPLHQCFSNDARSEPQVLQARQIIVIFSKCQEITFFLQTLYDFIILCSNVGCCSLYDIFKNTGISFFMMLHNLKELLLSIRTFALFLKQCKLCVIGLETDVVYQEINQLFILTNVVILFNALPTQSCSLDCLPVFTSVLLGFLS